MGIEEPLKRTWQEKLEDKQYADEEISPEEASRRATEAINKTAEKKIHNLQENNVEKEGDQFKLFPHSPSAYDDYTHSKKKK